MRSSRLARFEEKRLRTRLVFALLAIVGLITFLLVFGIKLVVGFFVFLDQMHGKEQPVQATTKALIMPPYMDPLPIATSSGILHLTGRGQANAEIVIYADDTQVKKTKIDADGTFSISSITLPEGTHSVKATIVDAQGKESEFSNMVQTIIKKKPPKLDITSPNDNSTITSDDNLLPVEGKTDDDTDVRINDRFVVIRPDNTFSYPFPLQDGDNPLTIKATDRAGNSTEVDRKVTYKKS